MHGGVPRYLKPDFIDKLTNFPRPIDDEGLDDDCYSEDPLIFDLLWSDPASEREDLEMKRRELEFAANAGRGGDVAIFSSLALEQFLKITNCSHLIRAHQPPERGVDVAKGGRVITVFSSSHYCTVPAIDKKNEFNERHNLAAAVLIADSSIRVIVLKPTLTEKEIVHAEDNFHLDIDEESDSD